MQVVSEPDGDVTVVTLIADQLDASNADQFRRDVDPAIEDGRKVVFDLHLLRFIDSRGCGVIMECLKHLTSRGGGLRLCGARDDVRTVFDLIRLPRVCPVHDTREEAVAAFAS